MQLEYIIMLGIGIIIGYVFWLPGIRKDKDINPNILKVSTVEDTPIAFGYKSIWFAVRSEDKHKVANVLNLKNIIKSNWQSGLIHSGSDAIFITPPINGWILATGWGLPTGDSAESLAKIMNLANTLSSRFDEAHFFGTHRVVEYHCWLKSVNGKTERVYAYMGEKGTNIKVLGEPTAAEKPYNLVNTLSNEAQNDNYFDRDDLVYPSEGIVMEIAGKWSVNPTLIEKNKDIRGLGLLGKLN